MRVGYHREESEMLSFYFSLSLLAEIWDLLEEGKKVQAIKLARGDRDDDFHIGLRLAKWIVDAIEDGNYQFFPRFEASPQIQVNVIFA